MPRRDNTRLIIPIGRGSTVVRTTGSGSRTSFSFVSKIVSFHSAVKRRIMLYIYDGGSSNFGVAEYFPEKARCIRSNGSARE